MNIFGKRQTAKLVTDTKLLENALALARAQCAEAERGREEAVKDLAEAHHRLDVVQRELSETRLRYYEAIGRYDQGQLDAVKEGGRG